MKKIGIVLTFCMVMLAGTAGYSKIDKSFHVEGMFHIANPSVSLESSDGTNIKDASNGFGFGGALGFGWNLLELGPGVLQARMDVSVVNWNSNFNDYASDKVDFTRIPIMIGARYEISLVRWFTFYPEIGMELSIDMVSKSELDRTVSPYLPKGNSETKLRFGGVFGLGFYFDVYAGITVGANVRYHLINNDYFTFSPAIGYKF